MHCICIICITFFPHLKTNKRQNLALEVKDFIQQCKNQNIINEHCTDMTLLSPKLWDDLCFSHASSTWWSCGLGCVWACGAYKDNSSSSPPYSRWIIYDSFWLIWRVYVYHPLLGVERSSTWVDNKRSKYLKVFLSLIISM